MKNVYILLDLFVSNTKEVLHKANGTAKFVTLIVVLLTWAHNQDKPFLPFVVLGYVVAYILNMAMLVVLNVLFLSCVMLWVIAYKS